MSSSSQLSPEQSSALALLLNLQAVCTGSLSGSSFFQRSMFRPGKEEQGATFSVAVETWKGLTAIRSVSSMDAPFRASNVEQETDASVCSLIFSICSTLKTPKFSNQNRSPSLTESVSLKFEVGYVCKKNDRTRDYLLGALEVAQENAIGIGLAILFEQDRWRYPDARLLLWCSGNGCDPSGLRPFRGYSFTCPKHGVI